MREHADYVSLVFLKLLYTIADYIVWFFLTLEKMFLWFFLALLGVFGHFL
jgi:hypothetical protein